MDEETSPPPEMPAAPPAPAFKPPIGAQVAILTEYLEAVIDLLGPADVLAKVAQRRAAVLASPP